MDIDYFRGLVFDSLNESEVMEVADIDTDIDRNLLFIKMEDGSVFEVQCRVAKTLHHFEHE